MGHKGILLGRTLIYSIFLHRYRYYCRYAITLYLAFIIIELSEIDLTIN